MDFIIKPHTVVILVGPSGCGKSYFSSKVLIPALKNRFADERIKWRVPNIQLISSDEIRKELLGSYHYNYKEDTQQLMAASEQAFILLSKKLELLLSYPINAEVVVVDSTGLNKSFRDSITSTAKKAYYNVCCVVFNYKDREEYLKFIEDTHSMKLVSDHISRLRREVLGSLPKRDFDFQYHIRRKYFEDINIVVEGVEEYKSCFLPSSAEYPVIGDIHGCHQDLVALLGQLDFKIENNIVVDKRPYKFPIIDGDFIDKGLHIRETIEFLYDNREHFLFILGNHENFVYKFLKNLIPSPPSQEIMDEYFSSIPLLKSDAVLWDKFATLVEMSKPFYRGVNFIATHSPCEDVYLGKMDIRSLREQRNFRYARQTDEPFETYCQRLEDGFSFLKNNAVYNRPIHVFGHCGFSRIVRYKNKIGIDTCAVEGNKLTSANVVDGNVYFQSVQSVYHKTEKQLPLIFGKKPAETAILHDVDCEKLEPHELKRIKFLAKNKVNYISGTMAPAEKTETELESLERGVLYYKNLGVDVLCAQPKYMGSRAEVFLNCEDISLSYTTSRKGYPVDDRIDLKPAYEKLWNRLKTYMEGLSWILIDVELMPWHALGKGLIESNYGPVCHGIESELKHLRDSGFESLLRRLCDEYDSSNYSKLRSQLSKVEIQKALTAHKCSCYEAIHTLDWIPLEEQERYFSVYKRQLDVFASPSDTVEFRPFSILKTICKYGKEHLPNSTNSEMFALLSDDKAIKVGLDDIDAALLAFKGFFAEICAANGEGIVLKPDVSYIKGVAPYLKVRNPEYLTIIYGYDYLQASKYAKLVRQKRTSRKLQTSIDEFAFGRRMLEIPRSDIDIQNKEYVSLVAKMILEEKKETSFDPRL